MPAVERVHPVDPGADGHAVERIGEGAGLRKVRPGIAEPLGAQCNETAGVVECQLALDADRAAMVVGEEIFRAGREPLDRTAKLPRHEQHQRIFREWTHARPERSADVDHVHADLRRRHVHDGRERIAHRKRALMGAAQLEGFFSSVVPGERGARLHRRRRNARAFHPQAHDMRRVLDQLLCLGRVTVLEIEAHVARNVGMNRNGAGGQRLLEADDGRQLLVFHLDQVGGVARGRVGLRDHHGHLLAGKAHAILRQQRTFRDQNLLAVASRKRSDRRQRAKSRRRNIRPGQDRHDAGRLPRRIHRKRDNARMRPVGALEARVELARQLPVVAIAPAAGDQSVVLATTLERRLHGGEPRD